jgi:predicted RNA-binding Zn-ribbon protein involved in translation (DUF1610 family)
MPSANDFTACQMCGKIVPLQQLGHLWVCERCKSAGFTINRCAEFKHDYRGFGTGFMCYVCGHILLSTNINDKPKPVEAPKPYDWDCYC